MDVLMFFTVRLCPWDMHLTGRRRRMQVRRLGAKRLVADSNNLWALWVIYL